MWPHAIVTAAGLWLTASPDVLGLVRPAATSAWIAGPLVATFATIAWWGATRPVRWANEPLALWLVAAPLLFEHSQRAAVNSVICGVLVGGLSAVRGGLRHRFGGGWRAAARAPRADGTRPAPHNGGPR